jgi:hypothetical protein
VPHKREKMQTPDADIDEFQEGLREWQANYQDSRRHGRQQL